jgi:hypothetical protein
MEANNNNIEFERALIINNKKLELIFEDEDKNNIPLDDSNYTLVMKILKSEYEYYYAVVPYEILHKNYNIITTTNITKEFTMIENKKEKIVNMIVSKNLLIGLSSHFNNPNIISIIPDDDDNEIVEFYSHMNRNKMIWQKYRWIQDDYLEDI